MPNTELEKTKTKVETTHEPNLKGAFVAVMALGAFIAITWFAVWGLYISR